MSGKPKDTGREPSPLARTFSRAARFTRSRKRRASCPQYNPNTGRSRCITAIPVVCCSEWCIFSFVGTVFKVESMAQVVSPHMRTMHYKKSAWRPLPLHRRIRPTPDIGCFRLDQLNKKNIPSVTDTAQEHARDHDQSIKMKNCKNTYPFFWTSTVSRKRL